MSEAVTQAFHRSIDEGVVRLERTLPSLLATGMVGGIDVSVGVFAMFVVRRATHSEMLGALAFGIGFIALTLANSELFTENFLVPITAVAAKKARWLAVLRLWTATAVLNLVGGWIVMGLVMAAFPTLRPTALEVGSHPIGLGITGVAFASAILGGLAITLMTWMERSSDSQLTRLVGVFAIAFLLAAAPLQHAIVISLEAFAALHAGAAFGYSDWLGMFGFAALGNLVGGVGLVTVLRLIQVGGEELEKERQRAEDEPRPPEPEATTPDEEL
ncbi:MAG: formate/nitrite transporter family protein [Acidimicrobiales bacterium]